MSAKMRYLHRIVGVPLGVNILGLLELFTVIGVVTGTGVYISSFSRGLAGLLMFLGVTAITALDLWWRLQQPELGRWTRLFSPFTGGCFVYVPIWLLLFALGLFVLGIAITKSFG
jgi:hypothetical protein